MNSCEDCQESLAGSELTLPGRTATTLTPMSCAAIAGFRTPSTGSVKMTRAGQVGQVRGTHG